jgi:hypothetical protein
VAQRAAEQRAVEQQAAAQRAAELRAVEQQAAELPIKRNYQAFDSGSRFENINTGQKGTVRRLRDDSHEQKLRRSNPSYYQYSVDYDDGKYDTYVNQNYMKQL